MAGAHDLDLLEDRPHTARMYNYFLGGKDFYTADRLAAEKALSEYPPVRTTARANRDFMHRATRYLAGDEGVHQFLDIGTGIPAEPNLHQIAQEINPSARIVYTDNDPIVLAYARALMTGTPEGRTAYIHADAREPESILSSDELNTTLDLGEPIAISLVALLHWIPSHADLVISSLLNAVAPGSFLVISHVTLDFDPDGTGFGKLVGNFNEQGIELKPRNLAGVADFFTGLEIADPGIVSLPRWRPDVEPLEHSDSDVSMYGGVARKP